MFIKNYNYGYIVLISCFLIMVLVYGAQYCFGVFFKPMIHDFGWSRAATSGPFAMNVIIGGILGILSGKISDKIGSRLVVTCGGLILGAGYLLSSGIQSLWQLYLYYGLIVGAGTSTMYVPLVALITRWFPQRRGLMAGIGISGIGFGIGVMPVLASHLVVNYNWRSAMVIAGITCLFLITILAQFLKNAPNLDNLTASKKKNEKAFSISERNYSITKILKSGQFWMFCLAWFAYGFYFQIGTVHTVPYAIDLGLTPTIAATILTTIGLVGTPGRILLGLSGDKFGNRNTFIFSFIILGLAYLGMTFIDTVWMLYLFGIIFGTLSGAGVLLAPILAEYFGYMSLGIIVGAVAFANALGGAVSPPLAGFIFDVTGTYHLAFLSCAILGLVSGILVWLIGIHHQKL